MSLTATGFGHLIDGDGASVRELKDSVDLTGLLAEHGVVLLRGFRDGVDGFEELTDPLGTVRPANIRVGTSRRFETGQGTQAVNAGTLAVPMHAESYYTPVCPQILAFTCVEFTASGGESLCCDGVELFAGLPEESRAALAASTIEWRHECRIEELEAQTQQPVDRFVRWCERADDCDVSVDEAADRIRIRYVAPTIRTTWWGGQDAFANNLIPINQQGVLASASPGLDPRHVEAAELRAAQISVAHRWQPQDIALIDNTRMMHARNPWSGVRHLRVRMLTVEPGPC
jgi:alpha-ketoglutarate-dependent taurine dioxygenase